MNTILHKQSPLALKDIDREGVFLIINTIQMLFEKLEDIEKHKDEKLTLAEKATISGIVLIIKLILKKINRAKTYGDLESIAKFIDSKIDDLEHKKYKSETASDEEKEILITKEIAKFQKELQK